MNLTFLYLGKGKDKIQIGKERIHVSKDKNSD